MLECRLGAVGTQQPTVIAVDLERAAVTDRVDHQEIAGLPAQFRTGVKQHVALGIAGLGGEPDDGMHVGQMTFGAAANRLGENIVIAYQFDGGRGVGGLFDLAGGNVRRPVVGDRGGHHEHV